MTPLCFIDTETTGLHVDRKVWEVGMIRRDDQGQHHITFYVDVDLSNADPFGLAVGRFYERHPLGRRLSQRAVDYADGIEQLTRPQAAGEVAIWTHGAHLVGSVPNFDAETLAELLREHSLTPAWHYHLIDVENLAVGWLHGQAKVHFDESLDFPLDGVILPWNSEELSRRCGVEPPSEVERHTALGDADWAMRIFDAVTGGMHVPTERVAVCTLPGCEQTRPHYHRGDDEIVWLGRPAGPWSAS